MIWKALRKKGLVEQDFHPIKTVITQKDVEDTFYSEFGDNAELRKSVKEPVTCLQDLIKNCNIID